MTKLEFSQRETILEHLKTESKENNGYFLMIVLSVIITTFGLLINSVAVIIGGMIVSPLLYPIMTVGAAIIRGDSRLFQKSLYLSLRSTLIAVIISLIVALVSPLKEATPEILARTQPTLIDLIIALASGAAGAYAVAVKQRFASLIGVVISAALVPPLAITGYGLAIGEFDLLVGSFLLYLANFIAVIVSTVAMFYVLGFRPGRSRERKEEAARDFSITVALLVMMVIVLTSFLVGTISNARTNNQIDGEIRTFLLSYTDTTMIELTHKNAPHELVIKATIQSPTTFTQTAVDLLDEQLEAVLKEDVNLQILHIPMEKIIDSREIEE